MHRTGTRDLWREERLTLLAREKELTRLTDERERLPAVEVEKEYVFEGPRPRMQRSKCMGKMRGG